LKAEQCRLFGSGRNVERAYLARVEYGDRSPYEVALCVRGPEDPELARLVGEKFAEHFARSTHLDILFLDEAREEEVKRICPPFYVAD